MSIQNLLCAEIQTEFNRLDEMEVGTEAYSKTVDGLTKLMDRAIEMEKFDTENKQAVQIQKFEQDMKKQQVEEERKDRLIKNSIAVAGIVVPALITIWGTLKSLKFEEEGTVTTIMGRGFINKLLPKK